MTPTPSLLPKCASYLAALAFSTGALFAQVSSPDQTAPATAGVAVSSQTESAALKAKDDQIAAQKAQLEAMAAEIAQLKAQLNPNQAAVSAAPSPSATAPVNPAPAASAPSTEPTKPDSDILQMSAFEVRTTQGQGYSAGNSASALKTSESLMDLPAQIIIVTSDMIKDIGSHAATDVLAYAGLSSYYRGVAVMARGNRIANPYVDDVPQSLGLADSDNTYIDTYQIIKGPEQVMYPLASLGGIVLETTKKPLPGVTQVILDAAVQQWGRYTITGDYNQPIGYLGAAQVTARVEGIDQAGDGPFYNSPDGKLAIYSGVEFDWPNTRVLVQYDAAKFKYIPAGMGLLTPNGKLYTGAGRREEDVPPGDYDNNGQRSALLSWTQRFSDNWQAKTTGAYFNAGRYGVGGFPTTVNWNNNTLTFTPRESDGWTANTYVESDVSGKYHIGYMSMTSAFGFNLLDTVAYSNFPTAAAVTIPLGSQAAINSITFPAYGHYPLLSGGNPGSRTEQYVSNGYFTQSFDVIPTYLTLVGGFTFSKIETVTDTNMALHTPYLSTDLNDHHLLHRLGAIFHVTKELAAYFSESSTFTPSGEVDYLNNPLASVLGKSDEVGLKTSFLDGKVSTSAAVYKMTLSNQGVHVAYPALNVDGNGYYTPIGTTTSKGWDASMSLQPYPNVQIVGATYIGTVRDQNNNPVSATYENSWSVFARYDFPQTTVLRGLAFGGGANESGGKWFSMGGLVLPGAAPLPVNSSGASIFKLHQDVLLTTFGSYQVTRHWQVRVSCENVLNEAFAIGAQGVGLVDPIDPRTVTFETNYKF